MSRGLKSWSKNKGPGRKPKFTPGELAVVKETGQWVVIVDYQQDKRKRGRYRAVRLMYPTMPYYPVGRPIWYKANWLDRMPDRPKVDIIRRRYNANQRIEERGCTCECCVHTALPISSVLPDGRFAWEINNDTDTES